MATQNSLHLPSQADERRAIEGTVDGLIAESFPGTANRSREELCEVVDRVHAETRRLVANGSLVIAEAAAYEFQRYREELSKP